MGRSRGQKARDKNKSNMPQVPKTMKSDGYDVEFSAEFADHEDLEAQARAEAAGIRQSKKKKKIIKEKVSRKF
ncbi:YfhD family protein [Anoxybacillus sp. KU2-6(11)]|uniref:YfhD family protein n=1 Tax=Anoxybacillus sp. KU2-6(11) TaxID=1535751 RepID=UPI000500B98C|nr:YfhD family protein [Anoxybacillus sp. KU2-6(11)]KFZ42851.1 hypothetical protein JS80_07445 [Anoxybacillus sp. KU2-6(11)]